jgi:hypothetical protein
VFELRTSLEDLLKMNITMQVIHASHLLKRKEIIGEVNVNLSTIWKQNCKHGIAKTSQVLHFILNIF